MQPTPLVPEPPRQDAGYLVVLAPAGLRGWVEDAEQRGRIDASHREQIAQWQTMLGLEGWWRYRGVDREAVARAVDIDEAATAAIKEMIANSIATLRRMAHEDPSLTAEERTVYDEMRVQHGEAGWDVADPRAFFAAQADQVEAEHQGWIPAPGRHTSGRNPEAEALLADLLGPDAPLIWSLPDFDADLVPELAMARAVLAACRDVACREIVRIARPASADRERLLGYDVLPWDGSRMSALRDCLLTPCWHPPEDEALPYLRSIVAELNEHLLFPTAEAAARFAAWYRAQPWAETASLENPFQPVAVERTV